MMDRLSPHPLCGGFLMTYQQLSPKFLFHIAQQPGTTFCRLAITRAVLDNLLPQLVHGALATDLKCDYVSILPLAPSCADSQVLLLTWGLGQRQQLIAHCVPLHLPHDCQTHCAKSLKNFFCATSQQKTLHCFLSIYRNESKLFAWPSKCSIIWFLLMLSIIINKSSKATLYKQNKTKTHTWNLLRWFERSLTCKQAWLAWVRLSDSLLSSAGCYVSLAPAPCGSDIA